MLNVQLAISNENEHNVQPTYCNKFQCNTVAFSTHKISINSSQILLLCVIMVSMTMPTMVRMKVMPI